jgi:hypothetical protein
MWKFVRNHHLPVDDLEFILEQVLEQVYDACIYVPLIISEILTDEHIAMENKLETAVISNNTFLNEVD